MAIKIKVKMEIKIKVKMTIKVKMISYLTIMFLTKQALRRPSLSLCTRKHYARLHLSKFNGVDTCIHLGHHHHQVHSYDYIYLEQDIVFIN